MFGLSVATGLIQGSTERTWNCVLNFASLLWSKINHIKQNSMPKSRKRHHSRSRSRSRSQSRDREDKYKRYDSYEKDRDGKRRKVDSYESPPHKRSLSYAPAKTKAKQSQLL
ncbi:unnamed protein product [Callosobruchus maculatus]|uniref:Uncharacterized protein n=1 Tax=Callosobruchus maculatus TaxID=64391 RepID=A0A653CY62_CALMS|nr:unnamed protein product [Callosobruchus maculatus]